MNVFTFWEGRMPPYIEMCLRTWKIPYTMLNYGNLSGYTDLEISDRLKRFTMPQIADCVRVHVLRDQGGYWLDADTIMLTDRLPATDMVGDPEARTASIGLLYSEPGSRMFAEWAEYQDEIIRGAAPFTLWSIMSNTFTDVYAKEHPEVRIHPIRNYWPETYMVEGSAPRYQKYLHFYFDEQYDLGDICRTDLLMLHNSWTPNWYKWLTESEILRNKCTLSNILRATV